MPSLLLLFVEAELTLGAFPEALDIPVVHPDRQGGQAEGHDGHHNGALADLLVDGIADPEEEGVDEGADDGAQGDGR